MSATLPLSDSGFFEVSLARSAVNLALNKWASECFGVLVHQYALLHSTYCTQVELSLHAGTDSVVFSLQFVFKYPL